MIKHNGAFLPSITWGLPILALASLLAIAAAAFCIRRWITWKPKETYDDPLEWKIGSVIAVLAALVMIIAGLAGFYPYGGDYHRLQPASGTVTAVDSRFLAASQYVVITYTDGLVVRCDDSRCATIRPGESLRLLCTKEHQLGSPEAADGWGCRWGQQ